jgi:sulfur carrier protein
MKVFINGGGVEINNDLTIQDFLESQKYTISNIAIEIDGVLCPRSLYKETKITEGIKIEIVAFVGGG